MVGLNRDFVTWWIRCSKCGEGKPKKAFEGSIARICKDCREKFNKERPLVHGLSHYLR